MPPQARRLIRYQSGARTGVESAQSIGVGEVSPSPVAGEIVQPPVDTGSSRRQLRALQRGSFLEQVAPSGGAGNSVHVPEEALSGLAGCRDGPAAAAKSRFAVAAGVLLVAEAAPFDSNTSCLAAPLRLLHVWVLLRAEAEGPVTGGRVVLGDGADSSQEKAMCAWAVLVVSVSLLS